MGLTAGKTGLARAAVSVEIVSVDRHRSIAAWTSALEAPWHPRDMPHHHRHRDPAESIRPVARDALS
jgi:hypothetical protein